MSIIINEYFHTFASRKSTVFSLKLRSISVFCHYCYLVLHDILSVALQYLTSNVILIFSGRSWKSGCQLILGKDAL